MPFQDAPAAPDGPMTPALRDACVRAIHVVRADGRVLSAGRAALYVLERVGFGWFARLLAIPPFVWAIELGYWIVARNRRFFARFLFRKELPAPPDDDEDPSP